MSRRHTIRRIRRLSRAFAGSLCVLAVLTIWKTAPGFPASVSTGFPDVASTRTDYQAILYVNSRGVMTGYSNGNFGPDDTIKRAEISALLVRALVSPAAVDNCTMSSFPDVDQKEWYAKYICTAKAVGFVSGYPDGNFRPGQAITAAEVSKIIALGFKLPITTTAPNPDEWYMPYVDALMAARAFPPTLRTPEQFEKRGEVAQTLAVLIPPETPIATEGGQHAAAGAATSSVAATTGTSNTGSKSALQIAMEEAQKRLLEQIQNAQNTSNAGMRPTTRSSGGSSAGQSSVASVASSASSIQSSAAAASSSSFTMHTLSNAGSCTTDTSPFDLGGFDLTALATDSQQDYAYFGADRYVYKVDSAGNLEESMLVAGAGETITAAAIDEDGGMGYFATTNFTNTQTASKLYRVHLDDLSDFDVVSIEGVYQALNMKLDAEHDRIVTLGFDNIRNRNVVSNINMTTLQVGGDYTFTGSTAERGLFVNIAGGMAYAGSTTMYKIRLPDMVLMDSINAVRSSVSLRSGAIDEERDIGYFGNYPSSGYPSVFSVHLGPFDIATESTFGASTYTSIPPTALAVYSPERDAAYFVSSNGIVLRVNTLNMSATPQKISVQQYLSSGRSIGVMAIDDENGVLYVGTTKGSGTAAIGIRIPLDWSCN